MKAFYILMLLFSSCRFFFPKNCEDVVTRNITNAELNLVPHYQAKDTIRFLDINQGIEYTAVCLNRVVDLRHKDWVDDYYCKNDGYFFTQDKIDMVWEFDDFPNGSYAVFNYVVRLSDVSFTLGIGSTPIYLSYDTSSNRLVPNPTSPISVLYIPQLNINNFNYSDVYKFSLSWGGNSIDTIYYNGEYGFLRMINNESNIDIVLKR